MQKFWALFERNVIISGSLALALCGGVVYLSVTGQPVGEVLAGLAGTACGYFFAAKAPVISQVLRKQPA